MEDDTPEQREEAIARGRAEFSLRQAQEDIEDIREWKQASFVDRWFNRRLRQKRDRVATEIMSGEGITDYVSYRAKLEVYRFANEILGMADSDQMAAKKDLNPNQTEN